MRRHVAALPQHRHPGRQPQRSRHGTIADDAGHLTSALTAAVHVGHDGKVAVFNVGETSLHQVSGGDVGIMERHDAGIDPHATIFPKGSYVLNLELLESSAPPFEWAIFFGTIAAFLALDRLVMQHMRGWYVSQFLFWIFIGIAYGAHYWIMFGQKAGIDWYYGYALEWVLSLDNLFVLHLVMTSFRVPGGLQHSALFCGIVGNVVSRLFLFLVLGRLVQLLEPVRLVFGVLLIWSGIWSLRDDDDIDPNEFLLVRLMKGMLGTRQLETFDPEERSIFVRDASGRLCATLLVPVILSVEIADFVFAVDSITAKVAQIDNIYITFSSSVLAMFGLRVGFFLIRRLVGYFALLKYGICVILVFIGVDLIISSWVHTPSYVLLAVVLVVFLASILASAAMAALDPDAEVAESPWQAGTGEAPSVASDVDNDSGREPSLPPDGSRGASSATDAAAVALVDEEEDAACAASSGEAAGSGEAPIVDEVAMPRVAAPMPSMAPGAGGEEIQDGDDDRFI